MPTSTYPDWAILVKIYRLPSRQVQAVKYPCPLVNGGTLLPNHKQQHRRYRRRRRPMVLQAASRMKRNGDRVVFGLSCPVGHFNDLTRKREGTRNRAAVFYVKRRKPSICKIMSMECTTVIQLSILIHEFSLYLEYFGLQSRAGFANNCNSNPSHVSAWSAPCTGERSMAYNRVGTVPGWDDCNLVLVVRLYNIVPVELVVQ
jgi:hypothetical protein